MEESYSKYAAVTVSDQGLSLQEDTGGNRRVTFDAINHGEDLGRIRQEMSATFAEKMDVSLEMTMENVQHSDNNAGNAEAEIISKERLLARRDGSRGEEKETKVEQELAELFKYAVYQEQGRRPWQRSMSRHWMGRIRLGLQCSIQTPPRIVQLWASTSYMSSISGPRN